MAERDLVREFCDYYHAYNNISPGRRVMQERVLREYAAHVGDVSSAGANELRTYLASLVGTYNPATIRQRLHAIRPFHTWLWQQREIDPGLLLELREVKPPRGGKRAQPRPYSRKEIQQFWRELDDARPWCLCGKCPPGERIDHAEMYLRRWRRGSSSWNRVQGYFLRAQIEAIAAMALYGGLRRDEIFRLELEEMHPENHYIVVRGAAKNEDGEIRDRPVPWAGDQHRLLVGRWLDLRAELAPNHDRPWVSCFRKWRLEPLAHKRFGLYLHDVGHGWSYHRLRHTFATEALRAGMPLEAVSRILGHSRVEQTLAYAELVGGDLVKASNKVSGDFNRALAPRRLDVIDGGQAA